MNTDRSVAAAAERALRAILSSLVDFEIAVEHEARLVNATSDLVLTAKSAGAKFQFAVEAKRRVTPQTALAVCGQLSRLPTSLIAVLYAPVISPRVGEILKKHDIGYVDSAGNCWLRSRRNRLLIERTGRVSERRNIQTSVDPFKPKSSRIVRAMLSEPAKGWQVRELAEENQVQVSPGLVVKVKRALIDEGYVVERDKRIYLRDPLGLLNAWSEKYPGPVEEIPLYFRGDPAAAEHSVGRWCHGNKLQYALAGFSAAWRLAPDVRYPAAAVYLEDRGFDRELLEQLAVKFGGKRVDTGPNLYLWRPFDRSVFANSVKSDQPREQVTSALQSYLDLKKSAGRGEDAANAVFEKYLSHEFNAVAKRHEERQRGEY